MHFFWTGFPSIRAFIERVFLKVFWTLLGYTVEKNLTWLTRPFLLVRGWGLGTRLVFHCIISNILNVAHPGVLNDKDWMLLKKLMYSFLENIVTCTPHNNFKLTYICKHGVYWYLRPFWDRLFFQFLVDFPVPPTLDMMNSIDFRALNWYTTLCVQNWRYPRYPWFYSPS